MNESMVELHAYQQSNKICITLAPAIMTILGLRLFTILPVRGSQSQNGFLRPFQLIGIAA
jgi:hypothetical protein